SLLMRHRAPARGAVGLRRGPRHPLARSFAVAAFVLAAILVVAVPSAGDDAHDASLHCQFDGIDDAQRRAARALLDDVPLIDGHNDLPWSLRSRVDNQLAEIDLTRDLRGHFENPLHTDLPRLRRGGVGAQFWSVYVSYRLEGADAVQTVIEQIDVVHRLIARYPDTLAFATTADEIVAAHRDGRIASLIGIEGGHAIGNSLAVLRQLHRLGARYMTLTHWINHDWADAATDAPIHSGLTDFGRAVVREMNRLGMLVDLSHVSPAVMRDAMAVSEAPVIFSHSSARGVTDHPRNVPDDVLRQVREDDGLVMVTFVPSFLSEDVRRHGAARRAEEARLGVLYIGQPDAAADALAAWDADHPAPRASVADVADHVDYLRRMTGIDHIGIGADYDGIRTVPDGLEDVGCYPTLLAELLRRGYTPAEVQQIAGGNALRVMRRVEAVAAQLADAQPGDARFVPNDADDDAR
ncbi:MAG: dipeptidase, partial [Acidobacteriota bacterium]